MTIKLGMKAKDKITGFEGVVTGIAEYISGCNQALLAPPVDEKGAHRDGQWFDVQRLMDQGGPRVELDNGASPGCDIPAPKR